jgi:hypothetical protein
MLTDIKLKSLKPRKKAYKQADRDGMYVTVSPAGTISFRYDYRLNGRRETLTIGRYEAGRDSRGAEEIAGLDYGAVLSLQDARALLDRARRSVEQGLSPSRAKVEKRTAAHDALTFDGWAQRYFDVAFLSA